MIDSFSLNARPVDSILVPSFYPNFKRQGLDDIIENAWLNLTSVVIACPKVPLLYVHASPGFGKVSIVNVFFFCSYNV